MCRSLLIIYLVDMGSSPITSTILRGYMDLALENMSPDELSALERLIHNERAAREQRALKAREIQHQDTICANYMSGFHTGLFWMDRWGWNSNPGGPHVWGKDAEAQRLSQICNDMWRKGWLAGITDKRRLNLAMPDELMGARSILEDRLSSEFEEIREIREPMPDRGFCVDDEVIVMSNSGQPQCDASALPYKGKVGRIAHKISLLRQDHTFYLVLFKGRLNAAYLPSVNLKAFCGR